MKTNFATYRRWIAEEMFNLDCTKDYFELTDSEITRVKTLMRVCNFSGRNYLGRSQSRQFWYHLQKGLTLPF